MTANQLQYWSLQENIRANREKEKETARSNQTREEETRRANLAKEARDLSTLSPTQILKYYTLFKDYAAGNATGYPLAKIDQMANAANKDVDQFASDAFSGGKSNFSPGTSHGSGGGGFRGGRDSTHDSLFSIFK